MKSIVLTLICCLLSLVMVSGQGQQARQLLSEAIYQEEVNGDLGEAIKAYQLIIRTYPDQRNVAAKAVLHLGICYEKLGSEQARQAYHDVISKYSDQADEVAMAKERISHIEAHTAELLREAEKHLKAGNELFKRWEYDSAIEEYEKAVASGPNSGIALNARYCIGQSWYRAGQYDKAMAAFTKLIEDNPNSTIAPVTELMVAQVKQTMQEDKSSMIQINSHQEDTIIDPETGITYVKIRSYSGKNDLISYTSGGFNISPDGRFMVLENKVVPVDGSDAFKLVEMDALRAVYAPGMKRAAFYADSSIWIVPVSPETGRTTGEPVKMVTGHYRYQPQISWSPDGERFIFEKVDSKIAGDIWIVNISDAKQTVITNTPDRESTPVWSPDGKLIVYGKNRNLWLSNIDGTEARMILPGLGNPCWSYDSKWLFQVNWGNNQLYSLERNTNYKLSSPKQVGSLASFSPDDTTVLFYRSSSDIKWPLKIVSSAGGPPCIPYLNEDVYDAYWSADDQYILASTEQGYKIMALSGGIPREIKIETPASGKPFPFRFSDDLKQIAFSVLREDGLKDLYVAPFSINEAKTTGPARMFFEGWSGGAYNVAVSWSHDGNKMAIVHEGDIWIVHLDNGIKEKITNTPEREQWVDFSPDGNMISYFISSQLNGILNIIPASGGGSKVVNKDCKGARWSNDSKSIVLLENDSLKLVYLDGHTKRQLFNIREIGLSNDGIEIRFSPDGKKFAFVGYVGDNDHSLIIVYSMETGKVSRLSEDNLNDLKYDLVWSHNGEWLSYLTYEQVKVRPEGSLWKADFNQIIEKLGK